MNQPFEDTQRADDPLERIVFITVPPHLERDLGSFRLNPKIPLPVETTGSWSADSLSWEQIIAAMLKILGFRSEHEHAAYYRDFVLAVRPAIVDELSETAVLKARNKDFDIAEEIFRALCGLLPGDAGPRLNLALLYEQRADSASQAGNEPEALSLTETAFELYRELMAEDDVMPDVYMNAGFFFMKQHNYERARSAFDAFLKSEPGDPDKVSRIRRIVKEIESQNLLDTQFKEAYDFIRMGKEEDGITKIREFLAKRPDVWNGWFLLGWAYRRLGRYEEGKEAFLTAIENGSTEADTLNELAICRMELGEHDESRIDLESALRHDPENVKVISNLGVLALKEGKPSEAASFFRTVLELEPDDPIAVRYLESLEG